MFLLLTPMLLISGNPCTVSTLAQSGMCPVSEDLIAVVGPEKWIFRFFICISTSIFHNKVMRGWKRWMPPQ